MEKRATELLDFDVFRTVFYYCFIIIVTPVASFFISKFFIFDGILGLSEITSNVYAAGVAILILHIALALFIYRAYAYKEEVSVAKPSKQD